MKMSNKPTRHNVLSAGLAKIKAETWEQSEEKKKADASLQVIKSTEPTTEVDASAKENKQKKQELTVKRGWFDKKNFRSRYEWTA